MDTLLLFYNYNHKNSRFNLPCLVEYYKNITYFTYYEYYNHFILLTIVKTILLFQKYIYHIPAAYTLLVIVSNSLITINKNLFT